jgi:hypothetical protein
VRLELTIPDLQSGALAAWRRALKFKVQRLMSNVQGFVLRNRLWTLDFGRWTQFGTEGEIRTLESSLEDSHVSSYITPARFGVRRPVDWSASVLACSEDISLAEIGKRDACAPVGLLWLWGEISDRAGWTTCATFGTPGRIRTRSLDVRSVALIQLSYRSEEKFRVLSFGFRVEGGPNSKLETRNSKLL